MILQRLRKVGSLLILSLLLVASKAPPEITAKEARGKISEILRAHISHKQFTAEIAKRSLVNFLDELDPLKLYLTYDEVKEWVDPSPDMLESVVQDYRNIEFREYQKMYKVMLSAIERRNLLETKIINSTLPSDVCAHEFEKMEWAPSEEQLLNRLVRVRSFQTETAKKFDPSGEELFWKRLYKQRKAREETLFTGSIEERERQILAFVIKACASSLDTHTVYFTPQEANQFMIQVQQRLFGIGTLLKDDLSGFTVVKIIEGGPADKAKSLLEGDKIIAVNGEPVVGMEISEVVDLIRGPKGTSLKLTVLRENSESSPMQVHILRDEIVLKDSRYDIDSQPFADGVIAHVHLHSFYQDPSSSSASDVGKALEELSLQKKIYGVILDLRNNSGGLLPQAVAVTGLFINKGVVVSIKDNTGVVQHLRHLEDDPVFDGPLIVLTNVASASASEIVAQTLQDYGRALIVGDKATYGKGSYQTFTLETSTPARVNTQGEYKVTRGMYYTVSGKTPQLVGAKANIVIPGIYSEMEVGERFAKYPLEPDEIPSNFKDEMTDIHPLYRMKVRRMYAKGVQKPSTELLNYLPKLQENCAERIKNNKNYQIFLTEVAKKELNEEALAKAGSTDLQLEESFNVMKDLLQLQLK